MSVSKHRKYVARLVYWANEGAAWYDLARRAGYEIEWQNDGEAKVVLCLWDERVVALMRRVPDGEWFGFVFVPEARTPRCRKAFWRLTHPRAPLGARKVTKA